MPKVNSGGLRGGSAGEPEERGGSPFFFSGVQSIKLLNKNSYDVRILPAFDYNVEVSEPAFKTSFVPYRDVSKTTENGTSGFNPWYFLVKGYEFVGNDGHTFISPLTLEVQQREKRGVDPLYDTFLTARNHINPDYKHLAAKPEKDSANFKAPLHPPGSFGLLNALVSVDGDFQNRVIVCKRKAIDLLKEDLDLRTGLNDTPVTPGFEEFLFGDITDPATGSIAAVRATEFGDGGFKVAAFHYSNKKGRLNGFRPYPIDLAQKWGVEILEGRYNLSDTDTVTKVTTAEEILATMVSDGFLPYPLIEEACSRYWTVPADPSGRTYFPGGGCGRDDGDNHQDDSNQLAPRSGRPAPAAAVPESAVPASARAAAPAVSGRPAVSTTKPAPAAGGKPAAPVAASGRPSAATPTSRPTNPVTASGRPAPAQAAASGRPTAAQTVTGRPAPTQSTQRPAATATRAPVQTARPAATQKPAAPAPVAAPVEEQLPDENPAADAPSSDPLTPEEFEIMEAYQARFTADPNSLSEEEVQIMMDLGNRHSAVTAQG